MIETEVQGQMISNMTFYQDAINSESFFFVIQLWRVRRFQWNSHQQYAFDLLWMWFNGKRCAKHDRWLSYWRIHSKPQLQKQFDDEKQWKFVFRFESDWHLSRAKASPSTFSMHWARSLIRCEQNTTAGVWCSSSEWKLKLDEYRKVKKSLTNRKSRNFFVSSSPSHFRSSTFVARIFQDPLMIETSQRHYPPDRRLSM